jgi:hypothetical protein
MAPDTKQVIITVEAGACPSLFTACAHHRDFPEVKAEGESPRAAATHLAEELAKELDCTPDSWHQGSLQQALTDLCAYVEQWHRILP